jgi:hypothetical protein
MVHHHHHQLTTVHSTSGHRPLQFFAILLDPRFASSFRQPSCANRHSIWPEGVLHYVYRDAVSTLELFTPAVVGSTADTASPMLLQHANTVCYSYAVRDGTFVRKEGK